ncbi:hypothetical protein Q3G72_025505 [Acer saccharum]|nr:hypothetical protein Q3G72_025505 [Acer saccharum]
MDPDNLDVEDINSESMEEDYDGGETQLEEDQEINDLGKGKVKTLGKKPPRQRKSTSKMNLHKALVCDGEFLHIRCCAHILNLIVQDGLKEIDEVVLKIRESIRYIKGSQVRKQKFVESVNHVGLDSKMGMRQDVPTRWNSTFLMLQSALYYRRVWCALEMLDSNYKHCPSPTEWEKVEKIATFLQHFYAVTCSFSGSKYPISNLYFPNVLSTYLLLKKNLESSDVFMKNMATKMYSKYDKYWGDFSVILAIALVLDPRYKMTFVEFAYKKVYGSESVELDNVRNKLFSLFNEYMMHSTRSTRRVTSNSLPSGSGSHESENITTSSMNATISSLDLLETQLELYLDEPKVEKTMKLDILNFWRGNEVHFPELSMMARDVLSIPVSSVASESAFSVGRRVLDQYRSSLKPDIVEAIVCSRDWIHGGERVSETIGVEEVTEDILNLSMEEGRTMESGTSK